MKTRAMPLSLGLALLTALLFPAVPHAPGAAAMAGVAVLMASWWVLEVVPIPVTSLLPLALFPALGILDLKATAANYGKPTVFLFLGGFLLALGLQRSGLHRRIALKIVSAIGSQPSRLILGFMVASACLSMWISNTASVMVILPIALSVLEEARARSPDDPDVATLGTAVMLGVAYAADIGGMATPIGTPPNLVYLELERKLLPGANPITFGEWMLLGLPLAVIFLTCGWALLSGVIFPLKKQPVFGDGDLIREALEELGPLRRDEIRSGLVFALVALLWITGSDVELGASLTVPGWRSLLGLQGFGDAAVAIAGAVLLYLVPSEDHPGEALMTWEMAQAEVPWGLLLLFGGGFALAGGFQATGLSVLVAGTLSSLKGTSTFLVVVLTCAVLTLLTELTSNTATATLVLPILAQAGPALGVDPRMLMIPATLSASCAFMMPVASPTQAIVFGSGYVTIRQMVRAGIWFNVLGVALVTLLFWLLGPAVMGIQLQGLPDWLGAATGPAS